MADNRRIAEEVLAAVGGASNVASATHCMTRLRLTLKDQSAPDDAHVKRIDGVIGAQWSGAQYQVIIGQNVPKVYDEIIGFGVVGGGTIDENLDPSLSKEGLTPKGVFSGALDYLSGSMVPMIPVLMCAGLFQTIAVVIGPSMLGLVSDESDLYVYFNTVYTAGFYFMPIYLGYNAARKLGVTPALGAFMGGILIAPTFVAIAGSEDPSFSVLGIPTTMGTYSQTVIPILLSVWVMSYVERLFKRIMPDMLTTVFTPFCTMFVMVPVTLCALAPLGSWLGNGFAAFFTTLGDMGGILAIIGGGLVAALWLPLVVTGMHVAVIMIAITSFMTTGVDYFILVATSISLWTAYGCEFATWLRLKDKKEKSNAFGYLITNTIGGVGEPFIYGIMFRYRRTWIGKIVGAFVAGATAIALHVGVFVVGGASNVLNSLAFVGGGTQNIINAAMAASAGFVTSAVLTYLFGFTADELEYGPESERKAA